MRAGIASRASATIARSGTVRTLRSVFPPCLSSLLSLRVTPDASNAYQEMLSIGNHQGITPIRTKDGRTLPLAYNAWEVAIAREPYYLSIGVIA
jgi:hypothetical protein